MGRNLSMTGQLLVAVKPHQRVIPCWTLIVLRYSALADDGHLRGLGGHGVLEQVHEVDEADARGQREVSGFGGSWGIGGTPARSTRELARGAGSGPGGSQADDKVRSAVLRGSDR